MFKNPLSVKRSCEHDTNASQNQHLSNGAPSPNSKPSASIVGILNVGNNL